jgi:hypothetical protein
MALEGMMVRVAARGTATDQILHPCIVHQNELRRNKRKRKAERLAVRKFILRTIAARSRSRAAASLGDFKRD